MQTLSVDDPETYRHIIELTGQVAWTSTPEGEVSVIGDSVTSADLALRRTITGGWADAVHPHERATVTELWRHSLYSGALFEAEYRLRMDNGQYRRVRAKAAPRRAQDGTVVRWYGTVEEIEVRRRSDERIQQLQAELIHVSRLSAMGAMATTLAHELNQPLTAVKNYLKGASNLLGEAGALPHGVLDAIAEATEGAERAGEIVRKLRELVVRGEVARAPESVTAVVQEATKLALIDARSLGIQCDFDLPRGDTLVLIDRIQIQQVLLNLLRNAVEVMMDAERRQILIEGRAVDARHVRIAVHDSGPGLAPAARAEAFEPFRTTKDGGMGVGLSICRTIIEAHGGEIGIIPSRLGGAAISFSLPRASADPTPRTRS